jgi:hypothetical protein
MHYDPDTGMFRWLAGNGRRVSAGDVAGYNRPDGYRLIGIGDAMYSAHRLAFVWMTGSCPYEIDHKDRNPSNNAWSNLRPASRAENEVNKTLSSRNKSGIKGVSWHKKSGKWRAQITIGKRVKELGCFSDINDAAEAYRQAAVAQWSEYVNLDLAA